jgi:hypothetical protein
LNLDLEPAQHQLTDTLRKLAETAAPDASGWDVFDAVGISELLAPEPGAPEVLGRLDWAVVLEELGAGCRDHTLIRSVRTFLDVFVADDADVAAGAAYREWVREHRSAPSSTDVLVTRCPDGGWQIATGVSSALAGLHRVRPTQAETQAVADRELLALAAYAVGIGRRCLELAQQRAAGRVVAGRRLIEHQGTSHRLARCAVDLTVGRVGLWRAAQGEDEGEPAGHRAPATAAACLSTALDCAHNLVQVFGAAGTSDPHVVRLFRTAYSLSAVAGPASALWRSAGARRLSSLA